VIACVPAVSVGSTSVATPESLSVTGDAPSMVPSSLKVTVPLGVTPLTEVTVAVSVTDWP
jgi:hypothetical protein